MNRVLAALDNSPNAHLVVARAVALARADRAKIRLLRVVPDVASPPAPSIFEPSGDMSALKAAAEAELSALEEKIPDELRDDVMVAVGRPWEEICRVAREWNADTVVIGAHRYGVVERMLGTTAAKVANHLDRPVLIVRPRKDDAASP